MQPEKQSWRRIAKPQWAEKLGPPPPYCLFCGELIHGHCLTGVGAPDGTDLEEQVRRSLTVMFSVCEECVDNSGDDLPARIDAQLKKLTRVN